MITKLELVNLALAKLGEYKISDLDPDVLSGKEKTAAQAVEDHYKQTLQACLVAHRWQFAKKPERLKTTYTTMTTVANNGSGGVRVTKTAHGLVTGKRVKVVGTATPGPWYITKITNDTFDLDGAVYSTSTVGTYAEVPLFGFEYMHSLPSDFLRLHTVNGSNHKRGGAPWKVVGTKIYSNSEVLAIEYCYENTTNAEYPPSFDGYLACQLAADICPRIRGDQKLKNQLLSEVLQIHLPMAKRNNAIDQKPDNYIYQPSSDARLGYETSGAYDPSYNEFPSNL
jgi:hypothetical protein